MPQNYFSGGVGDVLAAGEAGAGFVNDWMDRAAKQRAGYAAAPRIAKGDYRGAAGAYAQEGMADEARTLMGDQAAMEHQAAQDQRQAHQDELAAAGRRVEVLGKIAQGLMSVPPGQRRAALEKAMPVFGQIGVDPAQFQTLTEDQLTDEQLQLFGAELEKQWQAVNLGGGGVGAYNPRTNDYRTLREPDPKLVQLREGSSLIDPETRQVVASKPKTYAPQRGGGGSAGLPPPPQGWSPVRR